jgi:hypothetical protein
LIFLIGQQLFSRQAGIISGFILAAYGPALFFDGLIEKSIFDLFLLAVILFLVFCVADGAYGAKWLGVGTVLGLLALSRENALILVLVVPSGSRSPHRRCRQQHACAISPCSLQVCFWSSCRWGCAILAWEGNLN